MILIHTIDGKCHETSSVNYLQAIAALAEPDGVLSVVAVTVPDGHHADGWRMTIPVRTILRIEEDPQR